MIAHDLSLLLRIPTNLTCRFHLIVYDRCKTTAILSDREQSNGNQAVYIFTDLISKLKGVARIHLTEMHRFDSMAQYFKANELIVCDSYVSQV